MVYRKRKIYQAIFLCASLTLLSGCAAVIEGARGIAGVSTKVLEEGRKEAVKKTFNCNCDTCYNESKRILKEKGAYIYAEDFNKKMIAAYVSETDTTPVGVFFKITDSSHTQVEVSSPSIFGKEYIAGKIFLSLDKMTNPEKEEGSKDAE
jgi:hypothetical protein